MHVLLGIDTSVFADAPDWALILGIIVSVLGAVLAAIMSALANRDARRAELELRGTARDALEAIADRAAAESGEGFDELEQMDASDTPVVLQDRVSIKDFVSVEVARAITAADVTNAVRDALSEYAEKERANREKEHKAERKFQIWVGLTFFFLGSLVTLIVTWIFAAIAGAL